MRNSTFLQACAIGLAVLAAAAFHPSRAFADGEEDGGDGGDGAPSQLDVYQSSYTARSNPVSDGVARKTVYVAPSDDDGA